MHGLKTIKKYNDLAAKEEDRAVLRHVQKSTETAIDTNRAHRIKVAEKGGDIMHTKGPWIAKPTNMMDGEFIIENKDEDSIICEIAGGLGYSIEAGCAYESEANARLIAAAPDLLEALERIIYPDNGRSIDFISQKEYYRAYLEGGELEKAQRAIAKAQEKGSD